MDTPIQLVRTNELIAAPISKVWEILSDFSHPQRLAPTIENCVATGDNPGAVRVITSSRGPNIHERLLERDPSTGRYRYEVLPVGDMPLAQLKSYECTVTLLERSAGSTEIEWSSVGSIVGPLEPIRDFLEALYRLAIARIRAELGAS